MEVIKIPSKFPEAFDRYEEATDTSKIKTFKQLLFSFGYWQMDKITHVTEKQKIALRIEARKRDIGSVEQITFTRRNRKVTAYRDLKSGRFTTL